MSNLPDIVLSEIFSYLSLKDLLNASLVCKSWLNSVRLRNSWKSALVELYNADSGKLNALSRFGIQRISIQSASLSPELIVLCFPRLSHLELLVKNTSGERYWQAFRPISETLTSLHLCYCDVTDDEIPLILGTFDRLSALWLWNLRKITDAGLKLIPKYQKRLENLRLIDLSQITNKGIVNLRCDEFRLKRFHLEGSPKVFFLGQFLSGHKDLVSLQLRRITVECDFNDEVVSSSLTHLRFDRCRGITSEVITNLAEKFGLEHSLTELDIVHHAEGVDALLEHLSKFSNLQGLRLETVRIIDSELFHLLPLEFLSRLSLGWCWQLTDNALFLLTEIKSLKCLKITCCENMTYSLITKAMENLSGQLELILCCVIAHGHQSQQHLVEVIRNDKATVIVRCEVPRILESFYRGVDSRIRYFRIGFSYLVFVLSVYLFFML